MFSNFNYPPFSAGRKMLLEWREFCRSSVSLFYNNDFFVFYNDWKCFQQINLDLGKDLLLHGSYNVCFTNF